MVALCAWAIVAALGLQHVDVNGRVLAVLLVAEVAVIVVYSLADLAHPADGTISFDTLDPTALFEPGVGAILALGVLGFVGFESAVVYSEEARDPHRTVRIASYVAVGVIAGLYTLSSWAMSVATGPDQIVTQSQTQSTELIFTLAGNHLGATIVDIGRVLFVTSVLAAMISFHNTTARYVFALGRERVLPEILGRTSPRTGSPKLGSLIQTAIRVPRHRALRGRRLGPGRAAVLLGRHRRRPRRPAAHRHHRDRRSSSTSSATPPTTTSGAGSIAPVLAALALAHRGRARARQLRHLLGVEPTSPLRWGIPAAYLVIAVLGVIWALVLDLHRPDVYAAIGLGAKSATATSATRRHG